MDLIISILTGCSLSILTLIGSTLLIRAICVQRKYAKYRAGGGSLPLSRWSRLERLASEQCETALHQTLASRADQELESGRMVQNRECVDLDMENASLVSLER